MNIRFQSAEPDMQVAEERVDEESEESFPASDPPSHTPVSGPQIKRPEVTRDLLDDESRLQIEPLKPLIGR